MSHALELSQYRAAIGLDEDHTIKYADNWQGLIIPVLHELGYSLSPNVLLEEKLQCLHGVLATIDANTLNPEIYTQLETIAAGVNGENDIVDPLTLGKVAVSYVTNYPAADKTSIWVGDISRLKADVIVNAANSHLLGCRVPNHACIDNVIHSAAGPRLRDDCALIINAQQHLEPVGSAKITRAYALPAKYVLHTVGPQLRHGAQPTASQCQQLANVYTACLDVAAELESIRTVAFCAVSTGLFGYPKDQAARIALDTVATWLKSHPNSFERIIFNLYSNADAAIYEELLNDY